MMQLNFIKLSGCGEKESVEYTYKSSLVKPNLKINPNIIISLNRLTLGKPGHFLSCMLLKGHNCISLSGLRRENKVLFFYQLAYITQQYKAWEMSYIAPGRHVCKFLDRKGFFCLALWHNIKW